ncbi:hypothetical protein TrVFT333_002219 [Trichoderma virens FT-333]|nr:hypothetical protein TrVFT333_002219 [Trichoderma virens FT-333]
MTPASQTIQVFDSSECFQFLPDGKIGFTHVKILFNFENKIHYGHVLERTRRETFRLDEIKNIKAIPSDSYRPPLPPNTTIAPDQLADYFVKRPNLMGYVDGSELIEPMLREVEVCEVLLRNPHPNLTSYLGCQSTNGRIEGICFQRYPESLMQKLNPKALNKSMFLQSRNLSRKTAERYLSEVEAGIKHLHSLGHVHNDLNPSNIMITTDDTAVIIDFDSCVRVGESIEAAKIKRTYGWYDRQSQVAIESIDFAALKEIRTWLTGSCPNEFQYKDT